MLELREELCWFTIGNPLPIVRSISCHEVIVAPATGSPESIVLVLPDINKTMTDNYFHNMSEKAPHLNIAQRR